jgi:hypothetical protein
MKDSNNPIEQKPKRKPHKRVEPFTPWQIMVYDRSAELGITTRELANRVATPRHRFEHTTIWAWLRSPEGTPPLKTYTTDLNKRLATALELNPDVLAAAFDESRVKFGMAAAHAAQQGPLSVLRAMFANSSKATWKSKEIVKLIDDIRGV